MKLNAKYPSVTQSSKGDIMTHNDIPLTVDATCPILLLYSAFYATNPYVRFPLVQSSIGGMHLHT